MRQAIHIILLSGGSGSRLWPLSNDARSKQFLKVLRDANGNHVSMVQRTFDQIERVVPGADVTVATCATQVRALEMQVKGHYAEVVEPERRDTAPAIMLACEHLLAKQGAGLADPVIVMPIDSYVEDAYFQKVADVASAIEANAADIVLLGVEPAYPSEKYGYIVPSESQGSPRMVECFTEKPNEAKASELIGRGALWNCGVFGFRLGYVLDILSQYGSYTSYEDLQSRYAELPKNSFDYEVVETAESVAVIPYAGSWKDLGTWNTLTEEMGESVSGRVSIDEDSCSDVHAINELGIPVVIAGLHDSVVVATPDGVLVSGKEESAHIKSLVKEAAEDRPMQEAMTWGSYRVVDSGSYRDGSRTIVKEIFVRAGSQICEQSHVNRSEVWTIVSGEGLFSLAGRERPVVAGSVVEIPAGVRHALLARTDINVIEIQLGDILVESDSVRYGNHWGESN